MEAGQFIVCAAEKAFLADRNRKFIADLAIDRFESLPHGDSKLEVRYSGAESEKTAFALTAWLFGKAEKLGKR